LTKGQGLTAARGGLHAEQRAGRGAGLRVAAEAEEDTAPPPGLLPHDVRDCGHCGPHGGRQQNPGMMRL